MLLKHKKGMHSNVLLGLYGIALGSLWLLLLGLYGSCSWVFMAFKCFWNCKKRTHSSLLLGLYGSCSWVSIALRWFWDCKKRKHSSVLLGLYGSCSWVSMAPALGSLWLLFLGLYGSCSWVSMAPALGSIRLHQVKVTSGHIKSQQVTSGRPTTGHGFAH